MHKYKAVSIATIMCGALLLTGCAGDTDSNSENGVSARETGGSATKEVTAQVTFNGEDLELSDLHCGPVAAEDNEMRFLASFDDGEIQIDGSGGPDGSAVIRVRIDGESDYTNSAGPHVDFPESGVQADIELSNADEEKAPVVVDISC